MKIRLLILFIIIGVAPLGAQIRLDGFNGASVNPDLREGRWSARWISVPGAAANDFGVYHFRKNFELAAVPARFVVHVSADNRYKLYVNGEFASLGPARGDIYNWNFETVDIAPMLRPGRNVIAAVVWNFADRKPIAQESFGQTGLIVQGDTEVERVVDTSGSWLCVADTGYAPWNGGRVMGYWAAGTGESLDAGTHPWGWREPGFDDSGWAAAAQGQQGAMKGARDYPGRLLVPTPIPPMELTPERFAAVRKAEGVTPPAAFPAAPAAVTIPAGTTARLLLDNGRLTTGYFSLGFSGGRGANITVGYAEALYQGTDGSYARNAKGHRDQIEGKNFIGYQDRIMPDGGAGREFTSLWWRTWRYVELTIETGSEPLTIDDAYGTFTAYPFERASTFSAPGNDELNKILDIGWWTARLCANETYMDCPYYEQLQYFGDTRIQAMITMYNTRDPYMVRNAIEQGRQSIVADGITMSRYPSSLHQFISSFSLWWMCTVHDYWMMRGDEQYVRTLLPAMRGVAAWFEQWLKPSGSLDYVPHWFFADWAAGFASGEPVREDDGDSAFQDLMFILALDAMAELETALGLPAMADHYSELATRMRATIRENYWDSARGLFADTHDHRGFSQHVNSLAVLAGIVTGPEAAAVMERTLADPSLTQCTIYFRYYLHRALAEAGLGDLLMDNLAIWRDQMALGLTTWAEMPEPSRSDCHAWGSSPNIELYRTVLGIESAAPGFRRVEIAPSLGELRRVSGTMPHPAGDISASYTVASDGRLSAQITLPAGVEGTFRWKGREWPLGPGERTITE